MRADQIESLAMIEEKLVDVFVKECQPEKWPGMDSQAQRGDRYWHKKNALSTLRIVGQIDHLLRDMGRAEQDPDSKEPALERPEVGTVESEATALERRARAVLRKHGVKVH